MTFKALSRKQRRGRKPPADLCQKTGRLERASGFVTRLRAKCTPHTVGAGGVGAGKGQVTGVDRVGNQSHGTVSHQAVHTTGVIARSTQQVVGRVGTAVGITHTGRRIGRQDGDETAAFRLPVASPVRSGVGSIAGKPSL